MKTTKKTIVIVLLVILGFYIYSLFLGVYYSDMFEIYYYTHINNNKLPETQQYVNSAGNHTIPYENLKSQMDLQSYNYLSPKTKSNYNPSKPFNFHYKILNIKYINEDTAYIDFLRYYQNNNQETTYHISVVQLLAYKTNNSWYLSHCTEDTFNSYQYGHIVPSWFINLLVL